MKNGTITKLLRSRWGKTFIGFILGTLLILSSLASSIEATATRLPIAQINIGESRLMTAEEIRSLIKQAGDSWVRGDAAAFAALFAIKGEFIVPGKRWLGRSEIEKAAADFALAYDVKVEIRRIMVDGNQALVEWYWEDREKATGVRNQADDAIVIDFENGQIVRWREYIDSETWANSSPSDN